MNNKKSYGYVVGQALAILVFTCLALCIGSLCVIGTIKFLSLIFGPLF